LSIYFYVDGILFKITGARGTWKIKLNANGIAVIEFMMTGLFTQPGSAAIPANPTYGTQLTQDPQVANTANTPTFTIGGYAAILRNFTFDAGNEVKTRFLIRSESVIIPASDEKVEFQIEAVPLAQFDPYSIANAGGTQALSLVHGVGAGKIATLSIPTFQLLNPGGLEAVDGIVEHPLRGKALPGSVANSQFSLSFT
jgi:hypothetical protein